MVPNMRVGFDAKRAFNNRTGLGNYSRFVLEALQAHRPENEYLAYTPKNNGRLFSDFPSAQTILPTSWFDRKFKAYWRYARITNQLRKDNVDVFHGLSHELPQGLEEAKIGSLVTIHDLIFERLPHLFNPIDRLIYRSKFKSACSRADVIIAISEQTKRDLIELYKIEPDRIQVVYQDCNPRFRAAVDPATRLETARHYGIDRQYILCVGTLEERKNQLRLVEAFHALEQNDFQLVLVGKATTYKETIKKFIKHNQLEKRVLILENVPTGHLPALYQEATVFAYISIYEGFGIPILEALHSGTPVLAAKGSCLEEAGGPGGLYANPTDVADISAQLQKLISNQALRQSLVTAGQRYIQKFSGEIIAGQLAHLYEMAMKRK
jgi:glycosyltransferase involved in cell wall biosynthesis